MDRLGLGHMLVPIAISSLSGWHTLIYEFVKRSAEGAAARAFVIYPKEKEALFTRHAALLVRSNINCLLRAVHVEI